jgi:replicative DNA helicase
MTTGFKDLAKLTDGLKRGDLIVGADRPELS